VSLLDDYVKSVTASVSSVIRTLDRARWCAYVMSVTTGRIRDGASSVEVPVCPTRTTARNAP